MPRLNDLYPSNWLKADDLPEEGRVVTMTDVTMESVAPGEPPKPVLHFREDKKGLVLNKTNAKTIEKLYGDDTDEWDGRKITIFPTEVDFKGDTVMAIRIKSKAPKPAPSGNKRMTQEEADEPDEAYDNPDVKPTAKKDRVPF